MISLIISFKNLKVLKSNADKETAPFIYFSSKLNSFFNKKLRQNTWKVSKPNLSLINIRS